MPESRKLNVFLCHSSGDKPQVRALYKRLAEESWIAPWLDEETLIPGMDWNFEIEKALRAADVILFCLSVQSVSKEGYVQKEIRHALDIADEKPDGTIYDIPLRLEACEIPMRLGKKQWLDYYADGAHEKLLKALKIRAEGLGIPAKPTPLPSGIQPSDYGIPFSSLSNRRSAAVSDLYDFVKINVVGQKPFWIGKYPVTNAQYARFLQADDYANLEFWIKFPMYDENCKLIGNWGDEGINWLEKELKDFEYFPPEMWKVEPEFWQDESFGIAQPNNPVVGVTWYEANAYCKWLTAHWRELPEASSLSSLILPFRLPLETEWLAAAGGDKPDARFPWDLPGKATTEIGEIVKRANISESKIGKTTPVNKYPGGKSPHGVVDMVGNAWEWQANYRDNNHDVLALRGGSWLNLEDPAHVSGRHNHSPHYRNDHLGFRVAIVLPTSN